MLVRLPRARPRAVVAAARSTTALATTCFAIWAGILASILAVGWNLPRNDLAVVHAVIGLDAAWLGGEADLPTLELEADSFTVRLGRRTVAVGAHPALLDAARLHELVTLHPRVLLAPADDVALERIVEAMDALHSLGFVEVRFAPER